MTSRNWPPSPDYLLDELDTLALEITLGSQRSYEITDARGPAQRVLGVDVDELVGPLSLLLDRIRPSDRPPAETLIPSSPGQVTRFRCRLRTVDRHGASCKFSTQRIDDERLVMTVSRLAAPEDDPGPDSAEVSQELELVEKRYKAIFEASLDPLILVDPEGHFVEVSHAIEQILGWRPVEALGRHFMEYVPDDELGAVMELWKRLRSGESLRAHLDALHRDGTRVPVQISATSVTLDDETYVVFVMRDLRETTEMRTALEKIEHRLARSEKLELVGQLAGGFAHDIHNMLAVITGTAQMLLRDSHTEAVKGDAEAIITASKTAAELSRRLLELGKTSSVSNRVRFRETLDSLEPLLTRLLPGSIDFEVDLAPGLPAVDLDAGALEQLLLNLIINARDAVESDGHIKLSVRPTSLPSFGIQLEVEDNGLGMTQETAERIFEPLYTTKGDEGTGLGLSTVARIVDKAGGTCDVESEEGVGTCFTLRLPAAEHDSNELQAEPTDAVDGGLDLDVLLVDDTPNALRYLRRALASQGCETNTAESMEEALALLGDGLSVDVIVTDYHMPGGSGVELMQDVHSAQPDLPVVLVTADQFFEPPDSAAALLRKPFTPSELMQAVSRAYHGEFG